MALSPFSNVLPYRPREQEPLPPPIEVSLGDDEAAPHMDANALITEQADGGALVDFNPQSNAPERSGKFDANIANEMLESELDAIAADLIQGIDADNQSRQQWLSDHEQGIKLLGLVIEDESGNAGQTSAAMDGMSAARHPLLLEAVLMGQATARGELLPAAGPVKVRDDRPDKPEEAEPPAGMGHNGGPPLDSPFNASPPVSPPGGAGAPGGVPPMSAVGTLPVRPPVAPKPPPQPSMIPGLPMPEPGEEETRDALADALEKDFNHYLTTTAQEYYPDTDRMLFSVFFGGQGVKKVYNCPLRRRPVSESIAMEDFIVSNAMTDLANCARITHKIKMRPSVLKRMQLLGVYRDVPIGAPTQSSGPNQVEQAKAEVAGVTPQPADIRDAEYEVYECYCELDLDGYAPKQFEGKGLPLPYRVTIEKDSQKVLEIRRNWIESDQQCMAKEFFAEYPYVKAFGFYGIGLLHILGNLTKALTAMLRISIDNGMFANFPGFIYAKGAGRQLSNQFRVPPGGGIGLDVGLQKLADAVMPLPYRQFDTSWVQFQTLLTEWGQRLGGTANTTVAEGRADAPVGTTLALIEQATKPIGAVLKRLHSASAKEFQLLKDRFRDDPEAFWRFNKRPAMPWQKEQFLKALEDYDLVPVSDPNNPTKLHRAAKSAALQQIATSAPGLLNPQKVFKRIAADMEIADADDLLAPPMPPAPPPAPPPDPAKLANAQAKMAGDQLRAQTEQEKARLGAADKQEARASRIRELELRADIEREKREGMVEVAEMKLAATTAFAAEKHDQADRHLEATLVSDHARDEAARAHQIEQDDAARGHERDTAAGDREHETGLATIAAKAKPVPAATRRSTPPKGD